MYNDLTIIYLHFFPLNLCTVTVYFPCTCLTIYICFKQLPLKNLNSKKKLFTHVVSMLCTITLCSPRLPSGISFLLPNEHPLIFFILEICWSDFELKVCISSILERVHRILKSVL